MSFDANAIRKQFPILRQTVRGKPLVYLDNAATTQMPETVLDVIVEQNRMYEANVHRGIHYLSEKSTARMENARAAVMRFLGASAPEEIIFTSGTTDSINIAARSFCEAFVCPGDEIVTTAMEHHSNLVPWQELCARRGAVCRAVPITDRGELRMDVLESCLCEKTRLVAVGAVSNVLGTVNPIKEIVEKAHAVGARVLVDGAQAVRHGKIDVKALDCDFFAFSGHKIMGPTGTGVLWGRRELLELMPPVRFGGGMVDSVTVSKASFNGLPFRFEAGTPNIVGNIALGAALEFYMSIAPEAEEYENALLSYTVEKLKGLPYLDILGDPAQRRGAVSFNMRGVHYYDVAALLDKLGIAVRSGHHCAQPLLQSFGLAGAVRVSPAYYNTLEEIDALADGLERIYRIIERRGAK